MKINPATARIYGVLSALDIIYAHDEETIAEEILQADDASAILRIAKQDDYHLLDKLKNTVATVRARERRRETCKRST